MAKVQRDQQAAAAMQKEAPKSTPAAPAKPKGETLLAKAAREQMQHLEALQNSLGSPSTTEATEDDQGQHSGRSDEGQKAATANKKRRKRTGKK